MPRPRDDDAYAAGRLLQWGLRGRERPAAEPEYAELIDAYIERNDFRDLVRGFADGLGLIVLDVSDHGLVLAPTTGSAFALPGASCRASSSADDRLLDGLVQVALAATVFPRPQDLAEDPDLARPPVTVDEVEDRLRRLCERLAVEARERPDPRADEAAAGLYEAWRVYQGRLAVHATRDDRRALRGTRRIIEYGLERLHEFGCFTRQARAGQDDAWQPTRRYQVLVQELAATALFAEVRRVLAERAGTPEGAPDASNPPSPEGAPG